MTLPFFLAATVVISSLFLFYAAGFRVDG